MPQSLTRTWTGPMIRNVGIAGHGHCGKTSLASAMLYCGGAVDRLLRVDEGASVTDFDEEEVERHFSIAPALAWVEWQKTKINLIDTPGYNLFLHQTRNVLQVADSALLLIDGVAGVEISSKATWNYCEEASLPCAFVVNKLDRERASFERAVASIQENFGRQCVAMEIPIGTEKDFAGIVNLVSMRAQLYDSDGRGMGRNATIPAAMQQAAEEAHAALVEMVAEGNDELMEEFFGSGTLAPERLAAGLRQAIEERRLFPILCASALHNIGTDQLLAFINEYFPPPSARNARAAQLMGQPEVHRMADNEPASAFVFHTISDPYSGHISLFKVYGGVLKNDAVLTNERTHHPEKLCHLSVPQGRTLVEVPELHAGDIGAVARLKETHTSDTLHEKSSAIEYSPLRFPESSIAYAIHARTRNDEDKMSSAIHRLLEEDPALRFYRDPQTREFLLGGTGQQHVEIAVSRLRRRYNVDVELQAPKVPYRETIRGRADVQGRHKKQSGGHGQFGDCRIRMEPLSRGEGFSFVNSTFGGSVPKQFIPAVEKGIVEAAQSGHLAGYPLVDFSVTLYDGSYHDVDSSEMSFKQAARKAFRAAMEHAKPALLEPVMRMEIQAPVEFAGDLMGDINSRRGRVAGMDVRASTQIIHAMSEVLNYQNDLISMTQGRASFHMEFDHYDFVPAAQAEKIISAARAAGVHVHGEEDD
jgi:elongation factor G